MSTQPIGIDAALSRIQQIESLGQQVLSGAPGAASTAATSGGAALSSGAATPSFASVLAASQAGGTSLAGTALGAAPAAATPALSGSAAPAAVESMITQADALVGKPYVWGGGHSGWGPQPGYDCSGFVSAVLHAGGYLQSPQDTQTLPSAPGIETGPGQYVTIYDRTDAGGSDHVIIDLNGQFYESGGEAGPWGGGGGVQRIATPSGAYLSSFNLVLHPAGL